MKSASARLHLVSASLGALLISVTASHAQTLRLDTTKFTLPNGLTVLVHEDHKEPVVAINLSYHVGSGDEVAGKTGFAHLFEHLMFGGSQHLPGNYLDAMGRRGATGLNATTNADRTSFYETVPTSAMDFALFAESDRMGYLDVSQKTLDLQRGVVQNEKRQTEGMPYRSDQQIIVQNIYPERHPYGHTTIGSMADLNAASLADVQSWFHQYYGPSNAVLTLAGDITPAQAKPMVAKYFSSLPPGPPVVHPTAWVTKTDIAHSVTVQDRVPEAQLQLIWDVPGFGTAAADYLEMAASVLGPAENSRLYKRLVYQDSLATSVNAAIETGALSSLFKVSVRLRPGVDLDKVRAAVQDEMRTFLDNGPTQQELDLSRITMESSAIRRVVYVSGQAAVITAGQLFCDDPQEFVRSFARQHTATREQVGSASRQWLSDTPFELDTTPFAAQKSNDPDVDRANIPAAQAASAPVLPQVQHATLGNGLQILLVERHEVPLLDISLIVGGGYSADRPVGSGIANLTAMSLSAGTDRYTALQIADRIQASGAEIDTTTHPDEITINMPALSSQRTPTFELLADIAIHPSFPQQDFIQQQNKVLSSIAQDEAAPGRVIFRIAGEALFGKDHPYGAPLVGSGMASSVEKLTTSDLHLFHDTWFRPNNSTLLVVGDITLAELTAEAEHAFGAWQRAAVPTNRIPAVPLATKPQVYLVDKPGTQQTTVMMATLAPPAVAQDGVALRVWNDLVAGTFAGRLNMDLRENKHWTYGVSSAFLQTADQRPFIVVAPVQADQTASAVAAISADLSALVMNKPPTTTEVIDAVNHETLGMAGGLQSPEAVASKIQSLIDQNLPLNYFGTLVPQMASLNAGTVASAGKSFFHLEAVTWILVGDRCRIEPELKSLNLGVYHYFTVNGAAYTPTPCH